MAIVGIAVAAAGCGGDSDQLEDLVAKPARHATFTIDPVWEVEGDDPREAAHGIDIINVGDELAVIWAAQSGPSDDEGNWTHDIQRAIVDKDRPDLRDAQVEPLIEMDGAQEPVSTSTSGDYSITTWEDDTGDVLSQRFMLYRDGMPLWDEPRNAFEGGHSGHASSAQSWHAIALSEGWTDGGGVDNLGSGNKVYLATMDLDGNNERIVPVDDGRSWWPLTASGPNNTAVLWQKFAPDAQSAELKFSVFAPGPSGDFAPTGTAQVAPDIGYYEYSVTYLADLDSYVVAGNTSDTNEEYRGFLVLYDSGGNEIARESNTSAFVRESKPAIDEADGMVRLTYPAGPTGFQEFLVSEDRIELGEVIEDDFTWPTSGTAAAVTGDGDRYFVAFREDGIEQVYLD